MWRLGGRSVPPTPTMMRRQIFRTQHRRSDLHALDRHNYALLVRAGRWLATEGEIIVMHPNTRSSEFESHGEQQIAEQATSREPVALTEARLRHELEVHRIQLEARNEELRIAQHAVESSLQRYTELFDFAPLGYVVLDAAGDICEVNRAAAIILALSSAKLAGRAFTSLVAHTHRAAFAQFLGRVFQSCGAGAWSETLDLAISIEGTPELDVRLIASALMEGEPRAMVAILDLSPLRRAEAARAQAPAKTSSLRPCRTSCATLSRPS
jgi:PAS domain S-box-containing protein